MIVILLGASAILPSLLLVAYFHRRDVYREPPAVLWATFGLGIVIILPVCLVAWPLDALAQQLGNPLAYGFATAFLGAAIPEELFKFAVLYFFAARRMAFDEPMDGIVYGAVASLGFATLENVLYVAEGGFGVAAMRAVLSVPGHAFLGAIMGYYVGQARFTDGDKAPLLTRALVIPILLHGFYDAPLLASEHIGDPTASATGCLTLALIPVSLGIVVGEAVWAVRLVRRLRAEQLAGAPLSVPPPPSVAATPPPAPPSGYAAPSAPVPIPKAGQEPRSGRWVGWLGTLLGGVFACLGGLMTLGLAVALATEDQGDDLALVVVGGLIIGVLPLVLGMVSFFWGIRRLNRSV